ncbi:V/A-type H+-transporting ATPase subunit E [Clostridium pascui]|uniref:V-type ATP synthase subunit E n=1 Tax=Clostridium pascui TaxID=46609 RepID=UPI001957D7AF|nr:V-type ATP synthase subunit E family protein [Clostridium pascui]MBM7870011.1 V/A-type H+-transporting ATPase subunit E [Clostridium pascui]
MTTIEDKLKLFTKIVFNEIDEQYKKQEEKNTNEINQIILSENEKVKNYKNKTIRDIEKKITAKQREEISKVKMEMQRKLLNTKEKIIIETIEEVKKGLKEYSSTEEYRDYLLSEIKSLKNHEVPERFILYLSEEDIEKYKEDIQTELQDISQSFNIKPSRVPIIGGFILEDENKKFRIDNSLIYKIDKLKEVVGAKVMDQLNEEA